MVLLLFLFDFLYCLILIGILKRRIYLKQTPPKNILGTRMLELLELDSCLDEAISENKMVFFHTMRKGDERTKN